MLPRRSPMDPEEYVQFWPEIPVLSQWNHLIYGMIARFITMEITLEMTGKGLWRYIFLYWGGHISRCGCASIYFGINQLYWMVHKRFPVFPVHITTYSYVLITPTRPIRGTPTRSDVKPSDLGFEAFQNFIGTVFQLKISKHLSQWIRSIYHTPYISIS